ncbi:hypothetical protein [Inhella proteolytica]|uniref:Uncharacterized protein n=1 Tax=Inhella proteolytica TaxID=2795029 RepID=A0A931J1V2_9BURK|nr:hypothetical protein [Inhella proteolytica]MBH9576610.1 hypothetical protein [Inhella proteolytica]
MHPTASLLQAARFALVSAAALLGAGMATAQPAHHQSAQLLLGQIQQAQSQGVFADAQGVSINRYGGSWSGSDPSFIRLGDAQNGVLPGNHSKCSSFLTRLFQHQYAWNWNQETYRFTDPKTQGSVKTASPEAYQYVGLIQQGKGFTEIHALNLAQPGDVLAWWVVGSSSNDHAMLIEEVRWNTLKTYPGGLPNSNPALVGTQYVEVRVIDSSSDTHTQDTRFVMKDGVLTPIAGLGGGTIGLLLDANLRVIGRTWSLPTSDYYAKPDTWVKSLNERLKLAPSWGFAIGRLQAP